MSTKQTVYTADFKTKVVLEVLEENSTLNQVSAKYSLAPKSVRNWKKTFLENAYLAFKIDKEALKNKEKLALKQKEINELHRQLGKRTAELEWASKKLSSLDYNAKKALIESKLEEISIIRQCELCNFNRSNYYYKEMQNNVEKLAILRAIDAIYTEIPFYGYRKVHKKLLEDGHVIGINRVRNYMKELGLKVIYPTSKIKTTIAHPAHKKYPYLLRDLKIIRANQVIILSGETGSGKSTQLPKICAKIRDNINKNINYNNKNIIPKTMIAHTQPRRVAAVSLAQRISDEVNSYLGEYVGY